MWLIGIGLLLCSGIIYAQDESTSSTITIVRPEVEVVPEDGPILRSLVTGDQVVLVSYRDVLEPKVVRVSEDKMYLIESNAHPNHPACHFVIRKDTENFLHFISGYADGKAVYASDNGSFEVGFAEDDIAENQQWGLDVDEELEKWFGQIVRFSCRATGANLAVPSETMQKQHKTRITTAIAPGKAAGTERESRFKILPVNEIMDKIIVGGGKLFNYHPKVHSWFNPTFSKKWQSPVAGKITLTFSAQTSGIFALAFTSSPVRELGGMYYIRFGVKDDDTGEEQIVISKDVIGSTLHRINYKKKQSDRYWITIEEGVIKIGTGEKVGDNQIGFYSDTNPLKILRYVGLGGIADPVDYSNITITGEAIARGPELYLPAGFTDEKGPKMKVLASGSRNGRLEAWGISSDGNMYCWDVDGVVSGWKLHVPRVNDDDRLESVHDIALSSDGGLCCLSRGRAYLYSWAQDRWSQLKLGDGNEDLRFDQIAVGNKENIWASDATHTTVYQHTRTGWQERADACIAVACGYDGTVVVLNDAGEPYLYSPQGNDSLDDDWIDISVGKSIVPEGEIPGFLETTEHNIQLDSVAVINADDMYGITKDMKIVHFTGTEWQWVVGTNVKEPFDIGIARGFLEFEANAAGTLFATTSDGTVYKRGGQGYTPKTVEKKEEKAEVEAVPLYKSLRLRERRETSGRGVTREGRNRRARKAVQDVRVKRLNRGNLGEKVVEGLRKRSPGKYGQSKGSRYGAQQTGGSRTRSEEHKATAAIAGPEKSDDRTRGRVLQSNADMRMMARRSGALQPQVTTRESRMLINRGGRRERAEIEDRAARATGE